MAAQSFEHHAHQPALTYAGFVLLVLSVASFALRWSLIGGRVTMALGLASLLASVFVLLWISRVYTTRLQDRIIRLEMRVRGTTVLTPDQQRLLASLHVKQVVALRFASDGELPGLVERTAREQLPPNEIKRAIRTWVPDLDRT
jgi:uncharacterized protein DUF6526